MISFDPGKNRLAWAQWYDLVLVNAGCFTSNRKSTQEATSDLCAQVRDRFPSTQEHVVELPRIYPNGKTPNPESLVPLILVCGGLNGPQTTFYRPADWKGQLPKKVTQGRIDRALLGEELDALQAALARHKKALAHDIYDAVGVGLHHLNRGIK